MITIIFSLKFFLIFSLFKVNSVTTVSLFLVTVAGCCAIFISMMISSWFFYFIFLIYLGGVMVLILFVVSLCPEEIIEVKFSFKKFFIKMMFMVFIFIEFTISNEDFFFLKSHSENSFINLIYGSNNFFFIIILAIYLFFCMVLVVKISNMELGPVVKRL